MLAGVALALLLAAPSPEPASPHGPIYSSPSTMGRPLFEFLPASGAGAPVASDLCDAVQAGDKAGNWWCLAGDGGTSDADGGIVLSPQNSPTVQARTLCSNGLQCAAVTTTRLEKTTPRYYKSAATTIGGGDQSLCLLLNADSFATERVHGKWDVGNVADLVFAVDISTAGQPVWYVGNGAASTNVTTGTAMAARAWHLICGTYDAVGAGTSALRTYIDTTVGSASTTAVLVQSYSAPFSVGATGNGSTTFAHEGEVRGVFYTEKVLSASDVSRLANAVHGTLTGSRSEGITFARTSAQTCDNGAGAVTVLPNNRPCIAQSAYWGEGSTTNVALRSEEFDHASWGKAQNGSTLPVVTVNAATAPDGSPTAERVDFGATDGAAEYSILYQSFASSAAAYTMSVWLKGVSGDGTVYLDFGTAGNWGACSVSASAWSRCILTKTLSAGTSYAEVGPDPSVGEPATQAAYSAYVWGLQVEQRDSASSYARTNGSTATRAASQASVTTPLSTGDAWCMGGTIQPPAGATAWNQFPASVAFVQLGSAYGSANTASLYLDTSVSKPVVDSYDNAAANKYRYVSSAVTFGTRRVVGCSDNAGTFTVNIDGAAVSMAAAVGAGTGVITTMPTTTRLGWLNSGAYYANGGLSRVCIDRRNPGPCR